MQCLVQKRSLFNFILSNYILASVLITTTNHITTRNSYRYPRARCLFSLQVPSSARKGTLVTSEIYTSYFLKIKVAHGILFVAQMLLILFSIRTRRVVSLQILWPSQFTQTWPKRCRTRRHFDEGSCRYPRTLYHCESCIWSGTSKACFLSKRSRGCETGWFLLAPVWFCDMYTLNIYENIEEQDIVYSYHLYPEAPIDSNIKIVLL